MTRWTKSDVETLPTYMPKNKIRFITSTALFDGHDASINIMRRLLQARGAEVIHLGHTRSASEVVSAALQEDVQAIAISSYQGGHVEFFKYVRELLDAEGAKDIKIFGGGGGVIIPKEIEDLERNGITRIYSPEDGQFVTLPGIIGHMLRESDFAIEKMVPDGASPDRKLARRLTLLENGKSLADLGFKPPKDSRIVPVLGITGTGGAGKSSLTDELLNRFLFDHPECRIGVLCIDPSKKKTGGALLGDRIRMNSLEDGKRVSLRSMATRTSGKEVADKTKDALELMKAENFDFLVCETSGIGQGDAAILELADVTLYVMTAEFGASTQLEKIEMLDYADFVAINKFERPQSPDAFQQVCTVLRRSRYQGKREGFETYPVFGTIASRYNDDGVNGLYNMLAAKLNEVKKEQVFKPDTLRPSSQQSTNRQSMIPAARANYLSQIATAVSDYHKFVDGQVEVVRRMEAAELMSEQKDIAAAVKTAMTDLQKKSQAELDQVSKDHLKNWPELAKAYRSKEFVYKVRGKDVKVEPFFTTLSHLELPRVAVPDFTSQAETLRYLLKENVPGSFPFTGGVFPFRRATEDPKRQFAGEGGPSRTNTRFHYLTKNDIAKRLSTAFDSVTLYGSEPDKRPDIYGKVGESGVSIATLDDMKELYKGFDLCDPYTSVSMTINGPAPMILAMFLNAAMDQQLALFAEKNKRQPNNQESEDIRAKTLQQVRGTVQADILKEDQAQNTCIFSTEFALKLMSDMQEYFIQKKVRNYYSVSISGYHIAEAGANPITQLAFTLANGFTYVEYYLSRGMKIDDFSPNLSFFFSNGIDAEYSVLGRVARRIWAIAMRDVYGANPRAQQLKYHIQTSGRSLHAQEIDFNDIRTTLQALLALYDNCNSLHTNAYDEAITTPTEESVRRAMAIQLIINKEFGPNKCENINQGSYFLDSLTDMVEKAVCDEFERISQRGGVLGSMETQYQRTKIQEESLYYESLKDSGELVVVGVNSYQNPKVLSGEYKRQDVEMIRASYDEKDAQLNRLNAFKKSNQSQKKDAVDRLRKAVVGNQNIFEELMHSVRVLSLGEITEALFRLGGKYRRNM